MPPRSSVARKPMAGPFALLPHIRTQVVANATAPTGADRRLIVSFDVEIVAEGQVAQRLRVPVRAALRGPGDVIGIQPSAIARVEPEPGLRGFETNYFP